MASPTPDGGTARSTPAPPSRGSSSSLAPINTDRRTSIPPHSLESPAAGGGPTPSHSHFDYNSPLPPTASDSGNQQPRRATSMTSNPHNGSDSTAHDQSHRQPFPTPPPRLAYLAQQLQHQLSQQHALQSQPSAGNQYQYGHPSVMHPPQYPSQPGYFHTFSQPSEPSVPTRDCRRPSGTESPSMPAAEASSSTGRTAGPSPNSTTPPSAGSSQPKRKRKEGKAKAAVVPDQSEEDDAEKAKRTKTQRACDPCRRKKIRCDIIIDSEPTMCQHCKQYNYECTFYLPITETRFKKKRMEEAAAAATVATTTTPEFVAPSRPATAGDMSNGAGPSRMRDPSVGSPSSETKEVKIYGPTSLSFIMHSTPSIPLRAFERYDSRYHQTWEVGKSGDGFIQVSDHSPPIGSTDLPHNPLESHQLDREVLASLINSYFHEVSPQFPIVSEAEFLSTSSPPPVLLYAVCSVSAARRGVPKEVFDGLRAAVNQVVKVEDVLSTASVVNVQALLILGMSGDVHSTSIQTAMTAAWLRLGAAIRMAQDLGLYRAEAVKKNVELRRRLWGACVIADRWYGACFGHPFMIDVLDCDVRLPTPDDPNDPTLVQTKPNCYLAELIKLSILLGKVTKTIYSPSGLVHATDEIIEALLRELDMWRENLHPDLVYRGKDSIQPAGLLHLFYTCVCMMFWRVFLRLSYRCPAHLKFSLTVTRWSQLVQWSRESIEWLDAHERTLDSWMFVAYAASSCALIQYHTWARRRDPDATATLKVLRDCVQRWESSLPPGHMSGRRKTVEIIVLLYETTQAIPSSLNNAGDPMRLNPTVGVSDRPGPALSEGFRKLKFTKDPSHPGGGVFVADDIDVANAVSDVPHGTIIFMQAEDKDGNPAGGTGPLLKTETDDGMSSAPLINPASDDVASLLVNIAPLQPPAGAGGANASAYAALGRFGSIFGAPAAGFGPAMGAGIDFGGGFDQLGRGMQQKAVRPSTGAVSNVNPTMNYNYAPAVSGTMNGWTQQLAGGGVQVLNLLDQPLDGNMNAYQMLQGIPFDTFSSAGWEEYFARMAAPSGAQFMGNGVNAATNGADGQPGASASSGGGRSM